ncbi:hypothetical protein Ahy_B10g104895 [Arachis hypogaea]|uniref:SWIM-type domain-containing protein n=1 Tax=Arachis hypogaea TaxID=3818 RepID=A0A444X6Q8_ARAHY|nr:hypothetical protein Ahy_B10g104895 [Arachis hypogaea]
MSIVGNIQQDILRVSVLSSDRISDIDWASRFNKKIWLQHCDSGRKLGHITTKLSECLKEVLKGTCDCGPFQTLHFLCRHALTACATASVEWERYVHPVYI